MSAFPPKSTDKSLQSLSTTFRETRTNQVDQEKFFMKFRKKRKQIKIKNCQMCKNTNEKTTFMRRIKRRRVGQKVIKSFS